MPEFLSLVGLGFTQHLLGLEPVAEFEAAFSSCCGEEERRPPSVPVDVARVPSDTASMDWWHCSVMAGHGSSLSAQGVEGYPPCRDPLRHLRSPEGNLASSPCWVTILGW